jgi:hypothetical protein
MAGSPSFVKATPHLLPKKSTPEQNPQNPPAGKLDCLPAHKPYLIKDEKRNALAQASHGLLDSFQDLAGAHQFLHRVVVGIERPILI